MYKQRLCIQLCSIWGSCELQIKIDLVCEYFLCHGQPITKFESVRDLYLLLNVKNNPRKLFPCDMATLAQFFPQKILCYLSQPFFFCSQVAKIR